MPTHIHTSEKKFHKNFGGVDIVRTFASTQTEPVLDTKRMRLEVGANQPTEQGGREAGSVCSRPPDVLDTSAYISFPAAPEWRRSKPVVLRPTTRGLATKDPRETKGPVLTRPIGKRPALSHPDNGHLEGIPREGGTPIGSKKALHTAEPSCNKVSCAEPYTRGRKERSAGEERKQGYRRLRFNSAEEVYLG